MYFQKKGNLFMWSGTIVCAADLCGKEWLPLYTPSCYMMSGGGHEEEGLYASVE